MPGPVPHALYAKAYLQRRPELDERAVMRGAHFPDIRRLAKIPRERTHWFGVTLDEIDAEPDAWRVGLLLHNNLDDRWNQYMGQFGLVPGREQDENTWLALKVAEDELLAEEVKRYHLGKYFDGVPDPHELEMGASREAITQWDAWDKWKMEGKFDLDEWLGFVVPMGFPKDHAMKLRQMAEGIRADATWMERFEGLHRELGYGLVPKP